jgi:hypothetical protein
MALYDPIRDGFREFNNLLLDSKQWDERHAAAEADKDFKWSVLESNLVQQEFQNEMAQDRLLLLQHGDIRAAAMQAHTIKNQAGHLKVANEQLGISKDTLKFNRETTKTNQDRFAREDKRKGELHVETMEQARATSKKLTYDYTKQDATLEGIVSRQNAADPEYMEKLNKISGTVGASVGSDLLPVVAEMDEFGEPTGESTRLQLTPEEMRKVAPVIQGLNAMYTDPNRVARENVKGLDEARTEAAKTAAKSANYSLADKAFAKREVKKLSAQIDEEFKEFLPMNTAAAEGRRAKEMMALASWQLNAGQTAEAAATMAMAKKSYDASVAATAAAKGDAVQTWSRDLKDGNSQPTGKKFLDTVNMEYHWKDAEGNPQSSFDLGSDLNQTTDEPRQLTATERGDGTRAPTAIDDISKRDMVNFNDEFKADGMAAMFASDVGKPVDQALQHLATNYSASGDKNHIARQKAIAFYRIAEGDYIEGDTQRKTLTEESTAAELNNRAIPFMEAYLQQQIQAKVSKGRVNYIKRALSRARNAKNLKQGQSALKDFQNMVFKARWRKEAGDETLDGYIPNSNTRSMLEGKSN